MKTMKTKQERISTKLKLAKRLGLGIVEMTPYDTRDDGSTCYHVDYVTDINDCRTGSFLAVSVPYCYLPMSGELAPEVNYRVLESMGLKHIIFANCAAYMPLSLLKPDRYCYGIAWRENEAIHAILESYHLDEDEYYNREMDLITEAMPDLMNDLWDEVGEAHPEKAAELLTCYESRSDLIEDMVSCCSDIFEMAGEYPYLDGGQYPYLHCSPSLNAAVIDVIGSL